MNEYKFSLKCACPNCGKNIRLISFVDIPIQVYERKCKCGKNWSIKRTTLQDFPVRMDKLEWEILK